MSEQPWASLITTERIMELHGLAIEKFGGPPDVPDTATGCVDGALGNAWTASLYREPDESLVGLCFTSYLLVYIARDHCFTDGNKRVAWLSCMEVLAQRRLTLDATTEEAEKLMTRIIEDRLDPDLVADWVAARLVWVQ